MSAAPLVAFEAELRVAPEAGAWTVFDVPDSRAHFGTGKPVRVTGSIDGHDVALTLMPTGNGAHMGAVKVATRKAIGKAAGDRVHVVLQRAES